MADDRNLLKACGLHQACQVVDVIGQAVAAAGRPVGLAVPAKVRSNDMERRPQRLRQLIPTAGVIETAMIQDQRRRRRVAPIREVKSPATDNSAPRERPILCPWCLLKARPRAGPAPRRLQAFISSAEKLRQVT